MLSFAGRVEFIRSTLSMIHIFWASVYLLPQSIITAIDCLVRDSCQGFFFGIIGMMGPICMLLVGIQYVFPVILEGLVFFLFMIWMLVLCLDKGGMLSAIIQLAGTCGFMLNIWGENPFGMLKFLIQHLGDGEVFYLYILRLSLIFRIYWTW